MLLSGWQWDLSRRLKVATVPEALIIAGISSRIFDEQNLTER